MPLHISVQDIQRMHPTRMASATDFYYAKVGNMLLKSLQRTESRREFDDNLLELMAIKTTLYFEDVICDGGIWRSFVGKHRELYGKSLPFYPVDEEDYLADEPHEADIRYLLWETVMDWEETVLVHPWDEAIEDIAREFFSVLDAEFERAPINEGMQRFFHEAAFMNDFILMREVLEWLWMSCYITEGKQKFDLAGEMINEVCTALHFDEHDPRATYAAMSQMVFRYKCGPLALLPAEWLAMIMDAVGNGAYADMLRQIDYRRYELYLLEDFDDLHIMLRNTKDEQLAVRLDGYGDITLDTLLSTEGCVSSFVRFDNQWQPNGMDSWGKFRKAFEEQRQRQQNYGEGLPPKNYGKLMEESGGSPLFYFRNGQQVREFMVNGIGIPQHLMRPTELDDKEFIVAYVPSANESVDFAYGVANCIKDDRNPYYGMPYDDDDAMSIIGNWQMCDGAMVRYLIQHDMLPDASFSDDAEDSPSRQLAQEHLDFIARTVRRGRY